MSLCELLVHQSHLVWGGVLGTSMYLGPCIFCVWSLGPSKKANVMLTPIYKQVPSILEPLDITGFLHIIVET